MKVMASALDSSLTSRDLAMFSRIGVSRELLDAAGIERVSNEDARQRFGIIGPVSKDMAGIVFPYFSHVAGHRVTARVRRDHPEIENDRPRNKYVSPFRDGRHLYFGPGAWDELQDSEIPIVLVEAEKSVLALIAWAQRTGRKILPVGLGGCWGWRGRIGKTEAIDGSRVDVTGALPDLAVCDRRMVYVLLDANAASNDQVKAARDALVRELANRGCTVRVCTLPVRSGINGPDDFIAARGDDAMSAILDAAEDVADMPAEYADDALALRFTDRHGEDLRFTATWNRWSVWNGCVWS